MAFDYMEDCIHVKACRRLQKIGKSNGHTFGRICTAECSAYCSANQGKYLTPYEACEVARQRYDGNSDHTMYIALGIFLQKPLQKFQKKRRQIDVYPRICMRNLGNHRR